MRSENQVKHDIKLGAAGELYVSNLQGHLRPTIRS